MKTKLTFLLIFQIGIGTLFAQKFEKSSDTQFTPEIKVYSSGKVEKNYVKALDRLKTKGEPTAIFDVSYTGFTDEAKAAFAKATEIWSYLVSSPVPIKIDARWEVMDNGVLGSSGPPSVFRNFKNATYTDTWYHPSVANRLAGYDLDPESVDMITRYNSTYEWYLGTDGNCPANLTDLVTIVLHEIAHGLGFSSWSYVSGTQGGFGINNDDRTPAPWDHFMVNGSDQQLADTELFNNPSAELKTQLTSNNVFFVSPLSNEANGGVPAELYAPAVWDNGSSISHLGESYNGTDQCLMTYSAGTGEVTHHPGSITMGMLAEMGWVNVRFEHQHLKNVEEMTAPRSVEVEIYADTAVYNDQVFLHYSTDNFVSVDHKIAMTSSNNILFKADIPALTANAVQYYIEAKTKLDRKYYYPNQGNPNATQIDTTLSFAIETDTENPELIYTQTKNYLFSFENSYTIEAQADDNVGIDSVFVEYIINGGETKFKKIEYKSENNYGLPIYKSDLSFEGETLNYKDTVYYKVIAVDKSIAKNKIVLPENGYYKFSVHEIFNAENDSVIDFDNTADDDLFILDGFSVSQPSGFESKALHSLHPYIEGETYLNGEINFYAILKIPFILGEENPNILFDEIVLVEQGQSGSSYGDDNFWDYVIIEGSLDSGKTWHEFEDGYDCSISSSFTSAYNSNGSGSEEMYVSHRISLTQNEKFNVDDKILIRFRLWSDPATVGWGWAIDNIKIQKDAVPPTIPTSLEATEITDTSVNLSWGPSTDNEELVGYRVYQNGFFIDEVEETNYIVKGLSRLTSYSFYVKAKDNMDNLSDKSNTVIVTTTNTTDVADINSNTGNFIIYPNPALNYINIDYTNEKLVNDLYLTIYNIEGKIIYNKNYKVNGNKLSEQINTENFNKGIYIVKLSSSKVSQVQRLIIK